MESRKKEALKVFFLFDFSETSFLLFTFCYAGLSRCMSKDYRDNCRKQLL